MVIPEVSPMTRAHPVTDVAALVEQVKAGHVRALSRLITWLENGGPGAAAGNSLAARRYRPYARCRRGPDRRACAAWAKRAAYLPSAHYASGESTGIVESRRSPQGLSVSDVAEADVVYRGVRLRSRTDGVILFDSSRPNDHRA